MLTPKIFDTISNGITWRDWSCAAVLCMVTYKRESPRSKGDTIGVSAKGALMFKSIKGTKEQMKRRRVLARRIAIPEGWADATYPISWVVGGQVQVQVQGSRACVAWTGQFEHRLERVKVGTSEYRDSEGRICPTVVGPVRISLPLATVPSPLSTSPKRNLIS
ncbi:hypothetical protein TIFTF001_025804 [Ficus carica]|uniref:Uncharacterized protein n=1 Tax=Ficus carica TaxID=3494 RepID=A0AA88DGU1_FICCA|nr:hypothetical protein TIFTF001_025804 [Ficus carica]